MKERVAIITLFGNYNYGNRLQNYAVQKILESAGFEVETLDFYSNILKRIIKKLMINIWSLTGNRYAKRYKTFEKFNKRYVKVRNIYMKNGNMPSTIANQYDYFVVGSDQVWNPNLRKNQRDVFFLRFANQEQRICISPSVAVDKIDTTYESQFREYLNGFLHLSCREMEGAREISRISGKQCEHLIDPTLAITSDTWRQFEKKQKMSEARYALVFFLGTFDECRIERIKDFCKTNELEVMILNDFNTKLYYASPDKFVSLIDRAEIVFTDSFHAVAFSINMNTPFYAFDRKSTRNELTNMSSRITSLLQLVGLEEHYEASDYSLQCDFKLANNKLDLERIRLLSYLNTCLNRMDVETSNEQS